MLWLLLACDLDDAGVEFELPAVELGEALAPTTGLDLNDGDASGLAFPSLMSGWESEALPMWDVPLAIWAIALHERVADEGVCPFVTLDGADATYQSDCRSKHGYEWEGTVTVSESEEDGVERERWDFDLEVKGDVDDARFEKLELRGSVARADKGDLTHVDVNLQAELLGYFEARNVDDPKSEAWADWAVSGSEEKEAGAFRLSVAADIGGSGGFTLAGTDLRTDAGCPIEPTGEATLSGTAEVSFDGADACDACATITAGESTTEACAP